MFYPPGEAPETKQLVAPCVLKGSGWLSKFSPGPIVEVNSYMGNWGIEIERKSEIHNPAFKSVTYRKKIIDLERAS